MLVLSRRPNEKIVLHDAHGLKITITLLGRAEGAQTRLGIEAPSGVQVDREEVYLRKLEEKSAPCRP